MSFPVFSSLALTKTCIFRRYLTLRNYVVLPAVSNPAREAAHRARKLLKKQAKSERLRDFYGWCAGCEAYGSIF